MSTILDEILDHKREEITARKAATPLADLQTAAGAMAPTRGFTAALLKTLSSGQAGSTSWGQAAINRRLLTAGLVSMLEKTG